MYNITYVRHYTFPNRVTTRAVTHRVADDTNWCRCKWTRETIKFYISRSQ